MCWRRRILLREWQAREELRGEVSGRLYLSVGKMADGVFVDGAVGVAPLSGAGVKKRLKGHMESGIRAKPHGKGNVKDTVLRLQHFAAGGFNAQSVYVLAYGQACVCLKFPPEMTFA